MFIELINVNGINQIVYPKGCLTLNGCTENTAGNNYRNLLKLMLLTFRHDVTNGGGGFGSRSMDVNPIERALGTIL